MTRRDVDPADVQALARSALNFLPEAAYLLLRIRDASAARAFLAALKPTRMCELTGEGASKPLAEAVQVAFTACGLEALGLPQPTLGAFAPEFVEGMTGSIDRSQRLGDIGANAPKDWLWGYGPHEPHVLLMLYAHKGLLASLLEQTQTSALASGFEDAVVLPTSDMGGREPFGFVDGVSQPSFDWIAPRVPGTKADRVYTNLLALGELLLGYCDEYGYVTASPHVPESAPGAETLALAASPAAARDLGRNGSYLVLRQLDQDVRDFWRWVAREAERVGGSAEAFAETMVGRKRDGAPLCGLERGRAIPGVGPNEVESNGFLYDVDPDGLSCPIGAHIRRANPRTGDMPAGLDGPLNSLLATLGLTTRHETRPVASTLPWPRNTTIWPKLRSRDDAISSARFHRILRRGREYGRQIGMEEALDPGAEDPKAGLNFICLNTNISRQFEFIQAAWLASARFAGLSGEQDPLLGNREPFPRPPVVAADVETDGFSRPGAPPSTRYSRQLPPFVQVRGGAYFFLPGLAAYRWLTGAP